MDDERNDIVACLESLWIKDIQYATYILLETISGMIP